ncbi:hypothetical protein BD626DRAFT_495219 [Schizophyllum amplum]|uniref:Nnf1-domain-containing protein n=1 Tax=Schizophyllum amplum TaxID=97359 RepID=A0A550CG42_9AGAR|nr:hypothetical protein BD626DRAFT_495219 [Auriculariopsis ampla]
MDRNTTASRRWVHFHSALQLAVSRASHKWTFEDFALCFPDFVERDRDTATQLFNRTSDYIESQISRMVQEICDEHNMQTSIDTLHRIVAEAKELDQILAASGRPAPPDVWALSTTPRNAIAARTVPQLQRTRDALKAMLAERKSKNIEMLRSVEEDRAVAEAANREAHDRMNAIEGVIQEFEKLPVEPLDSWAVTVHETVQGRPQP